jgi:hypothetical protein
MYQEAPLFRVCLLDDQPITQRIMELEQRLDYSPDAERKLNTILLKFQRFVKDPEEGACCLAENNNGERLFISFVEENTAYEGAIFYFVIRDMVVYPIGVVFDSDHVSPTPGGGIGVVGKQRPVLSAFVRGEARDFDEDGSIRGCAELIRHLVMMGLPLGHLIQAEPGVDRPVGVIDPKAELATMTAILQYEDLLVSTDGIAFQTVGLPVSPDSATFQTVGLPVSPDSATVAAGSTRRGDGFVASMVGPVTYYSMNGAGVAKVSVRPEGGLRVSRAQGSTHLRTDTQLGKASVNPMRQRDGFVATTEGFVRPHPGVGVPVASVHWDKWLSKGGSFSKLSIGSKLGLLEKTFVSAKQHSEEDEEVRSW